MEANGRTRNEASALKMELGCLGTVTIYDNGSGACNTAASGTMLKWLSGGTSGFGPCTLPSRNKGKYPAVAGLLSSA